MSSFIKGLFYWILDFCFPSHCINCETSIPFLSYFLCEKCLNQISFIKDGCEICSGSFIDNKCVICSDRQFYLTKNIAIAEYTGVMKEIMHHFKFNQRRRLYIHLSILAFNNIEKYKDQFNIITSVPMNRKKKWLRGFNQSELIAKRLAKQLDKEYCQLLKEKSSFRTQRELRYRDRFLNVLDRYNAVNIKLIEGI